MTLSLGIKSDPIQYRYSYNWLFRLMKKNDLKHMQLGSFFELYSVDLQYFKDLKAEADEYDVQISSCFTAHRELGGFLTGNQYLTESAFNNYKRYIDVAGVLGSDYIGSNPGAVYRDTPHLKDEAIRCYLHNMEKLMAYAFDHGIKALTIEPMSCSMEPPTTPDEIDMMMEYLNNHHQKNNDTVPVYLCGDISHGLADKNQREIHSNIDLFEVAIPHMCEFHFKNTDTIYNSTFGFSEEERNRGIVDLGQIKDIIYKNSHRWPVEKVVGYLEIGGPKLGRDYSDHLLENQLQESISALKTIF